MPANVPMMDEFNALEARVAALESGSVTPPDTSAPSPDGATATAPGTVLISAAHNALELCEPGTGQNPWSIAINGTRDSVTHDAVQLYAKGGKVYQQAADWWVYNDNDGSWSSSSDPT